MKKVVVLSILCLVARLESADHKKELARIAAATAALNVNATGNSDIWAIPAVPVGVAAGTDKKDTEKTEKKLSSSGVQQKFQPTGPSNYYWAKVRTMQFPELPIATSSNSLFSVPIF